MKNKWLWWGVAGVFGFQIYFVRELLAAELLFALIFLLVFSVGAAVYFVGRVGDRGLGWVEARLRPLVDSARFGWLAPLQFVIANLRKSSGETLPR